MENKYWTLQPEAQVEMLKKDVYAACNLFQREGEKKMNG